MRLHNGIKHTARILTWSRHPWETLTNDQGLSVHGQKPVAARWALLPDECDDSGHANIPGLEWMNLVVVQTRPSSSLLWIIRIISLSVMMAVMDLQGYNSLLLKHRCQGSNRSYKKGRDFRVWQIQVGTPVLPLTSYVILVCFLNLSGLQVS